MFSQNLKLFNPMFSDLHNCLHFSFDLVQSQGDPTAQINVNKGRTYVRWKLNKYDEFNQVFGDDTGNVLQQVNGVLDSLNTGTVTPDQVNSVLGDIGATLINTASVVFGPENNKLNASYCSYREKCSMDLRRLSGKHYTNILPIKRTTQT